MWVWGLFSLVDYRWIEKQSVNIKEANIFETDSSTVIYTHIKQLSAGRR